MRLAAVMLAWWFLYYGHGNAPASKVGPFTSAAQCNDVRRGIYGTSICWEAPEPAR